MPYLLNVLHVLPDVFQDQRMERRVVMCMVAFMCLKSDGRKLLLKDTSKSKEVREKIDVAFRLRNFSRTETTRKKMRTAPSVASIVLKLPQYK